MKPHPAVIEWKFHHQQLIAEAIMEEMEQEKIETAMKEEGEEEMPAHMAVIHHHQIVTHLYSISNNNNSLNIFNDVNNADCQLNQEEVRYGALSHFKQLEESLEVVIWRRTAIQMVCFLFYCRNTYKH
jgi:catalase